MSDLRAKIDAEFQRQADIGLRAFRPKRNLFIALGLMFAEYGDRLYSLSEAEFVGKVMHHAGGMLNPHAVRGVYLTLMDEAGVLPPSGAQR